MSLSTAFPSRRVCVVSGEADLSTDGGSCNIHSRQLCSATIKLPGDTCPASPQIMTMNSTRPLAGRRPWNTCLTSSGKKESTGKKKRVKENCQRLHFLLYNQMVMNHVKIPSASMNKYFVLSTDQQHIGDE